LWSYQTPPVIHVHMSNVRYTIVFRMPSWMKIGWYGIDIFVIEIVEIPNVATISSYFRMIFHIYLFTPANVKCSYLVKHAKRQRCADPHNMARLNLVPVQPVPVSSQICSSEVRRHLWRHKRGSICTSRESRCASARQRLRLRLGNEKNTMHHVLQASGMYSAAYFPASFPILTLLSLVGLSHLEMCHGRTDCQ